MVTVATGIVAHPQRQSRAEQLAANINADFVAFDDGCGPGANHTKVWQELAATDAEWGLCIEDDAVPVINFCGQLAKALAVCPVNICSLYLGRLRPPQHQARVRKALDQAAVDQACWIISDHLMHAVAVAIRTELIPAIINDVRHYMPIDDAMSVAARRARQPVAYAVPSIVDHNDRLPTLMRHRDRQPRTPGRVAWRVGSRTIWDSSTIAL